MAQEEIQSERPIYPTLRTIREELGKFALGCAMLGGSDAVPNIHDMYIDDVTKWSLTITGGLMLVKYGISAVKKYAKPVSQENALPSRSIAEAQVPIPNFGLIGPIKPIPPTI